MVERPLNIPEVGMQSEDFPTDGYQDDPEQPVVVPIEDTLDLHTFQPSEVKNLLQDYLEAASEKGFEEVVIIHGKGSGILREKVRSILRKHPLVRSFQDAGPLHGGWGATAARLLKKESN
jgi:DNA-nicking Smr family endonuclease